jgi:hypothetical protein
MNPPDLQKMLEQAQEMQSKMGQLQAELAGKRFEASAGGGMISAVATGDLKIVEIRIEDAVFEQADRELVQDLVIAAVNTALASAQQHVQEELQRFSLGGLDPLKPGGEGT